MSHDIHQCSSDNKCHEDNHLCRIIIRKDLERIKRLVKAAEFFCKNCGRAAAHKENLCNPSRI